MNDAVAFAGLSPPPRPHQGRPAKPLPPNIGEMLALLYTLLTYGRHLHATIQHRAAVRGFASIAQFFGTARVPVILARLSRGLLRIVALQHVLLARAARGRDLMFLAPREQAARKAPPAPAAGPQVPAFEAAPQPPPPAPARRPARDAAPDPANLPTLAQLEAETRRHPIGWSITEICRDLAISPSLCDIPMWNAVFQAISWYRGNLFKLVKDFRRRSEDFVPEWDQDPALGIPQWSRADIRHNLGFLIGERPVMPSWMPVPPEMMVASTGPP